MTFGTMTHPNVMLDTEFPLYLTAKEARTD